MSSDGLGLRVAGAPVAAAALPGLVARQLVDGLPWTAPSGDAIDGLLAAFAEAGPEAPAMAAAVVAALGADSPLLRGQAADALLRMGDQAPAEAVAEAMQAERRRLDGQRHPERQLLFNDIYDVLLTVLTASAQEGDALAIETMRAGAAAGRPGALGLARLRPAWLLAEPSLVPRQALGGALLKLRAREDRVALIQAFAPFPDADTLLPAPFWRRFGAEGEALQAVVEAHRAAGPPPLIAAATAALDAAPPPAPPERADGLDAALGSLTEEQRAALLNDRALMSPEAFSAALAPAVAALSAEGPAAATAALRGVRAALMGAPDAAALGPVLRLLDAAEAGLGQPDGDLDAVAARLAAIAGARLPAATRAGLDPNLLDAILGGGRDAEAEAAAALKARVKSGIDASMAGFRLKPLGPS